MKGYIRNIPIDKPFGFIKSKNVDNIFLHKDSFHGDWNQLIQLYYKKDKIKVEFELTEGAKGPRAEKCVLITEEAFRVDGE